MKKYGGPLVLLLFTALLLCCVISEIPLVYALLVGLALFLGYGKLQGASWKKLASMAFTGVWQARKILFLFILIGSLSAAWRCSGTIAALVCYCGTLIRPAIFLPTAFLLNALISFLTGTSFGTAATMGVISMTMGTALGLPAAALGGAILSGAFFGDRCSPVSSSALLVADTTDTDIYVNLKGMFRTAAVPLSASIVIYLIIGLILPHGAAIGDMRALFETQYTITPIALLPAVLISVCALLKPDVRVTLAVGILTALPICVFVQHTDPAALFSCLLTGYRAEAAEVAGILNGGGITSMVNVAAIVCISSAYSGVFKETGILNGLRDRIEALSGRSTPFIAVLFTSVFASAIACSQTLAILLTNQLCENCEPDEQKRAIMLENSAVIVPPLIPWSIAGAVPLATIGAPGVSLLMAVYLYLIPLWNVITSLSAKNNRK